MNTIAASTYSSDFTWSDFVTHRYAPAIADVMGWPTPVFTVAASDIAGADIICAPYSVDVKAHRHNYGTDDDPVLVVEDRLRWGAGCADFQAHCWPLELPGRVVLLEQHDAVRFLRENHRALGRVRYTSRENTTIYGLRFSLLDGCLPPGAVRMFTVNLSVS